MEKKMVKQFSLTKLALALAIIGQFSGVYASSIDKTRCDRSEICTERLKMLIFLEEVFDHTERLYEEFPVEKRQEEFEKNLQNNREKNIKLLRETHLEPLRKSDIEHIERAERLYKESLAPCDEASFHYNLHIYS